MAPGVSRAESETNDTWRGCRPSKDCDVILGKELLAARISAAVARGRWPLPRTSARAGEVLACQNLARVYFQHREHLAGYS
eukprot:9261225-Pyramimonas_sp.AAC.1